jgi:hypothetical protein
MRDPAAETSSTSPPMSALRRLVRQAGARRSVERCELCGTALPAEHQHLIEPASRKLSCACDACALLFDGRTDARFRRVPRRPRSLSDFVLTETQWDELLIPINMAFLFFSTPAERIVAMYPSPAGATESLLSLEAWQGLVEANPVLGSMQPDVEALLVNRLGAWRGFAAAEYYLAPIDDCYRLVGLIRTHWRGLSGGTEVWQRLGEFFAQLNERSVPLARGTPPGGGLPLRAALVNSAAVDSAEHGAQREPHAAQRGSCDA